MAWKPPGANELRSRVRFQKRGPSSNVGGVVKADWVDVGARACRLMPVRGGEETMADRNAGVSLFDLVVRFDSLTRTITTDYRVVADHMAGRVFDPPREFAVKWMEDLEGKGRWLVALLEAGKGDGRVG
jgi:head-tail adaptor